MMVVLSELSQTTSSSPSTHGHRYDVFLSFQGLDTRNSFTSYLHDAFVDANITTFLDDQEIETGEDLKPEPENVIKSSRASVIVLSKNYAASTWCLDELVLILEQRMASNQIVVPIFYHVEPTHLRKQESSFGDAMAKHRQKMEAETDANERSKWARKIDRWTNALMEVADLKGKNVNGRVEMDFIEEIVKDIYYRLHVPLSSNLPLLIGMDHSIEFVTSWLQDASSRTTDILTILGMGGIGKTSIAKYIYGLHCHEFKTSSFIGDISRRCGEKFSGLLEVQKQLCDDISKRSSIQVHDVSIYTSRIENLVGRKKMLLVLDDIDSLDQLDALLGSKGLNPRSKIIITTKDAWLTESCALFKVIEKPTHTTHLLKVLPETESRQLFCYHAFMSNHPKAGYKEVTKKFVNYCEGHPLALEVLSKSLHNRDVDYWEDGVKRLIKETGSPIDNILRMSFDSLPSKNDKELFKHIACFFVGTNRDIAETILKSCHINTRSGITNLMDRCLLSIGWNNEMMMHQLLQKMGRFLVHQESPEKPWKRSRLWCHDDSFKVLKQKKGKENLLGLTLDMRMVKKEKLHASFELKTDALSNMEELMLLKLNYVQFKGSYENFPEELRWLCMHGFSLKSIPLDLPMENLVALDMSYSSIESFGICYSNSQRLGSMQKLNDSCSIHKRSLGSLKILNLSFCEQLRSVGSFDRFHALEMLILTNCIGLLEVCESIEQCVELVFIDMSYCNKLQQFPKTINKLNKVKTLLLVGCNPGNSRMEIKGMDSPGMLKGKNISIHTKCSSSAIVEAIPRDLKVFSISLPRSLVTLALGNNNLSTESFPMDFSWLTMLKDLYLDENPIISMPNCVRTLPRLELLSMRDCKILSTVEHPPHTLTYLNIHFESHKSSLRKVVFDPKVSPLQFTIGWKMLAPSSFEFEGMVKIQPMAGVEEKVFHSLGWTELGFVNRRHVGTQVLSREIEESETQMYYEFGIFSTIYGGKDMPNWITNRNSGPSISFTIPSSPKQLRGLNFCNVLTSPFFIERPRCEEDEALDLPMIIISNVTKNHTWIYHHYIYRVDVDERSAIILSHWMFGMNEMEGGDQVTIIASQKFGLTKEVGVSFVYDDGNADGNADVEDALDYYKSWNHIIGGDLIGFQTTTGEYILNNTRFMLPSIEVYPYYRPFIGDANYREKQVRFKALSQRKSDIRGASGSRDVRM